MEKREINIIAKDLLKQELEFRENPNNAFDVQIEQELFKELNALGYTFYSGWQFGSSTFSEKDKAVIPIIIKYLDKFEAKGFKSDYLCCLGVKGFYDATEYLINEYKKYIPPSYNGNELNFVSQTIANIQDPKYVDTYIDFLRDDIVVAETCYIIKMLGLMKAEKAIPHLIRLLEGERIIDNFFYGTSVETGKYLVSQTAIEALSRFKNPEHIKYIEKFLEPENIFWIQFADSNERKYNLKYTYNAYKKITQKAIKRMTSC